VPQVVGSTRWELSASPHSLLDINRQNTRSNLALVRNVDAVANVCGVSHTRRAAKMAADLEPGDIDDIKQWRSIVTFIVFIIASES
jgi:hypothetical protein